jgi:hypothetical protein
MKALQSNQEWRDHKYPLFNASYNLLIARVALANNPDYPISLFAKLAPATCNNPNREIELRKHEWVNFYLNLFLPGINVIQAPTPEGCSDLNSAIVIEAIVPEGEPEPEPEP